MSSAPILGLRRYCSACYCGSGSFHLAWFASYCSDSALDVRIHEEVGQSTLPMTARSPAVDAEKNTVGIHRVESTVAAFGTLPAAAAAYAVAALTQRTGREHSHTHVVAGEASASQDGKDERQCLQNDTELEEVSNVGLQPWVACLGLVEGAKPEAVGGLRALSSSLLAHSSGVLGSLLPQSFDL